jgi:hypothetical protein
MALTILASPKEFDFTGNPIAFKVSSDYSGGTYQIVARLFVETAHKSGSYTQVQDNYLDPGSDNAVIFYPGPMLQAHFEDTDIANLWKLSSIIKSTKALRRYYVEFYEYYSNSHNNVKTSTTLTAINGKLDPVSYVNHTWLSDLNQKKNYFHDSLKKNLAWKTGQQLLYFLNTTAGTNNVDLKADIYYTDDTSETQTVKSFSSAYQYDVLIMPAGYTQLNIGSYNSSKTVYKYVLSAWIGSTQVGKKVAFYIENKPWWGSQMALLNRYGVFEIFSFRGKKASKINYAKSQGKKHLSYNYQKTDRQSVQRTTGKEKEHKINTGLLSQSEAEHFEQYDHDIAFIEGTSSWIPVQITSKKIDLVDQDNDMHNIELTYKLSYEL